MEPFKNWLGMPAAKRIASAIRRSDSRFKKALFLTGLEAELEPLELKDRMRALKKRLVMSLPNNPPATLSILTASIKQRPDDSIGLSGFEVWPLTHYVAEEGLTYFDLSMKALHAMTQVFTAEFAIRPFLLNEEERTLRQLRKWANDKSDHVRRLVSEGSRPLLPWGERLPRFVADPTKTWPLLEHLNRDTSAYVRKSVANHINDHSKNHAEWVVRQLKKWDGTSASIAWIIRHGTRTLIKQGHAGGLTLHGIDGSAIRLLNWDIKTPNIRLGDSLEITVALQNSGNKTATVLADVNIQLLGARGQHRSKVFKGRSFPLASRASATFNLRLPIRPVTTRRYYSGQQLCTLMVNGRPSSPKPFRLHL